jgi:hypothetical protein
MHRLYIRVFEKNIKKTDLQMGKMIYYKKNYPVHLMAIIKIFVAINQKH